jgi:uncharacterized protein
MMTDIATTQHTPEERNWAMAAHLSALVAIVGIPFGHVIGPLVVYLIERDKSPFAAAHARASLNFQITLSLAAVVLFIVLFAGWAAILVLLPEGAQSPLPFWILAGWMVVVCVALGVALGAIALVVAGAVAASKDQPYRYPFAISFVR